MDEQMTPAEMRETAERLREIAHGTPEYAVGEWGELEGGADALDRLAGVIQLHHPERNTIYSEPETVCAHRYCTDGAGDQVGWPCETVRIARGETNGRGSDG